MKRLLSLAIIICAFSSNCYAIETESDPQNVSLPVLMYHRILKNDTARDVYTISMSAFEQDLKFLSENGYTSVATNDVYNFLTRGTPLPEKPVLLTFDDGHYSTLTYAVPLLERYGFKASVFVVGTFTEMDTKTTPNPAFSYITWEQMDKLPACLEIGNHSYNLHSYTGLRNGITKRKGESLAAYRMLLASDLLTLQSKIADHTGSRPIALALPFGARSSAAFPVMDAVGLRLTFGSTEGINSLNVGGKCHELKRLCRLPHKSAEFLLDKYAKK
ncbi:xylanase deacetylase [Clostridia bacterium]|nr:xylanase deacetylase [Clostridia bacterium]